MGEKMSSVIGYLPSEGHTLRGHPENPGRMTMIWRLLEKSRVLPDLVPVKPRPATAGQLTRVHRPELVRLVQQVSLMGGGRLDPDTYVTEGSYELARLAAGTTCALVDQIATGAAANGLALIRPPGHHAGTDRAGGFCLFNNIAVAARQAQVVHGLKKVLIIDFDVHHGNGTQQIFYADPTVLFVSLHLFHHFFYPGSGAVDELGTGRGQGATVNVPFQPGVGDLGYCQAFRQIIRPKVAVFQPDLVLVSAGFDAHWVDPLASASLSLAGYADIMREILALADDYCDGRVLFVLEGGYHSDALAYGVLNLAYALLGHDEVQDPLGPAPDREAGVSALLARLRSLHLLY
jgi:acetoin utilization deacetylase AcuC-like enzyme